MSASETTPKNAVILGFGAKVQQDAELKSRDSEIVL